MSFELLSSRLITQTTLDIPLQAREQPDLPSAGRRRVSARRAAHVAQRLDTAAEAIQEALPHYKTSVQNICRGGPADRFYALVEGRDFPREGIPLAAPLADEDSDPVHAEPAADAGIPVADREPSAAEAEDSADPPAADAAVADIFIMQGWPPGVPFPGDPELQAIAEECWPHLRITTELDWATKWTTRLCRTFKTVSVRLAMMFQPVGDNVLAYFVAGLHNKTTPGAASGSLVAQRGGPISFRPARPGPTYLPAYPYLFPLARGLAAPCLRGCLGTRPHPLRRPGRRGPATTVSIIS
jgi:hypothetical protein